MSIRKIGFTHTGFNPLTHNDTFRRIWERSLLKALWEKEKLLVQAISPFSKMFSTLSKTEIIIFVTFNLSSANAFSLVWCKILSCGNGFKSIWKIGTLSVLQKFTYDELCTFKLNMSSFSIHHQFLQYTWVHGHAEDIPQELVQRASFPKLNNSLILSFIFTYFNTLKKKSLRKHCGKRWN